MNSLLHHRSLWSLDTLSSADVSALLDTALALKQAALAGHPEQRLRGKNIAVMCESPDTPALREFSAAATALGARVAHIKPPGARTSPETASLLAKLYDAIDCEGMPLPAVQDVERGTGRPVFNGLAEAAHPLRVLGDLMTLREHSGKPLSALTLCYVGDASSPAGTAWQQSAALTGLGLRVDNSPAPAADFIWNERDTHRCSDGRVQLACTCGDTAAPRHTPLADTQVINHRYALQALLCSTVA